MNDYHLTFDLDWCSDETLDYVSDIVSQAGKKATWFATHKSAVVEELSCNPDYEVGLHPNFLPGSTHGSSVNDVYEHITELFPQATSMRTHGLHQSSAMLNTACTEFSVAIDVSLLLPFQPNIDVLLPTSFGEKKIVRIPYFWEDDIEMLSGHSHFSFSNQMHHCSGLKIYDFHPVHVALNTSSFAEYRRLAEIKPIPQWDRKFILKHQNKGKGTLSLLEELFEAMEKGATITEIAEARSR